MKMVDKGTWQGNIIRKLDIKMMRDALRDVTSIASLPISAEIHFKTYMNLKHVDLWNVLHDINDNTFIDYIISPNMYIVALSIYAIERRMAEKGGTVIEHFNDLQCLFFEIFYTIKDEHPAIADEIEFYLEKDIDAICEHLDIGQIYKKLKKGDGYKCFLKD